MRCTSSYSRREAAEAFWEDSNDFKPRREKLQRDSPRRDKSALRRFRMPQYSEEQLKQMFREADTNKAGGSFGTLYRSELFQYLKKKGLVKNVNQIEAIMDKYDTSGDHKIQFGEFRAIMNDLAQ